MEHLLLPKYALPEQFGMPYVCADIDPYDRGTFLDYPARMGKPWMLQKTKAHGYLSYDVYEKLHPAPVREREQFFQAWLFFGLLYTLLGDLYNARDYIRREDGSQWICTAKVLPNLEVAWRSRVQNGTKDKSAHFQNVAKCLRMVLDMIRTVDEVFDWRISLSIASVAERLGRTLNQGFQGLGVKIEFPATSTFPFGFPHEKTKAQMMRAGWCPSDIASAIEKWPTIGMAFFFSRMDKSQPERSHARCTDDHCAAHQINMLEHKTKHFDLECACPEIGIDSS